MGKRMVMMDLAVVSVILATMTAGEAGYCLWL